MGQNSVKTGIKDDNGKVRMDLLPPDCLKEVARILTDGANHYGAYNWLGANSDGTEYPSDGETALKYSRVYAALLRHAYSWFSGETIDKESGRFAMAHVICNALFLLTFDMRNFSKNDDRPKINHENKDRTLKDFHVYMRMILPNYLFNNGVCVEDFIMSPLHYIEKSCKENNLPDYSDIISDYTMEELILFAYPRSMLKEEKECQDESEKVKELKRQGIRFYNNI